MSVLRKLFERPVPELRSSSRSMPLASGSGTAAGVAVSPERSLQLATVYACVRILSEQIASLPTGIYRRTPGYRTRVEDHKLAELLLEYPNEQIDSGELWRTVMGWMLLRGNGYVYVERGGTGAPKALWPVAPTSVEPKRNGSSLHYKITPDESTEYVPVKAGYITQAPGEILHYRAFGLGLEGLSPIAMARQQIGTAWASTAYIGGFFARDASPGGRIQVPGNLTNDQFSRLTEQWNSLHRGVDNSHKLAVLEGGATWEQTTLSPADAQFLEVYKLSRTDIATGIYSVPPHMVGDLDRATFSNIEQQSQDFIVSALGNWIVRLERVTRRLFPDRADYLRFNVDGRLRGDTAARTAAYVAGRQWGWLSANDVLRSEDKDPIGAAGDVYVTPLNMVPAGSQPTQRTARGRQVRVSPPAENSPWVNRVSDLLAQWFSDQPGEEPDQWDELLAALLAAPILGVATDFGAAVAAALGGVFEAWQIENWVTAAAEISARNINETTRTQLHTDGEDAWDQRMSEVDSIAAHLVNAAGNFGRHEGARQSGVTHKTWVTTSSKPRASHARMNGETVEIDQDFSNGLPWPGAHGRPEETAGCQCTIRFSGGQ